MGKICEQFEAEAPTDSEATQKARFEMVLDLMQQVRLPLAIFLLVLSTCVLSGEDMGKDATLPNLGGGGITREAI
jgi:hypothetical protein